MEIKNKNEKNILKLNEEYVIFLDESGDSKLHDNLEIYNRPTVYPIFTITALIIKRSDYEKILLPKILYYLSTNRISHNVRGSQMFAALPIDIPAVAFSLLMRRAAYALSWKSTCKRSCYLLIIGFMISH